ncbi:hypothetical protein R8N28_14640 [Vibrio sp. Vb1554]|uniref:hypothetical protein n=1 Tax=Vibrio TaxID=662 RepID=UPI000802FA66|nr:MULTISPECIES: hypothetical protein [Vibrio]ANP65824.1 hypothetical protein BAU10_12915 [Vibrio alginolyticus]EJA7359565.1 hypothetical protein [Vibrio alginolyticus]MDW1500917.1 hypothetical protein [Vibrio sp. YT-19(2023)]MDW3046982.1 hypothetical protein [Vibrio sp. Vb1554]
MEHLDLLNTYFTLENECIFIRGDNRASKFRARVSLPIAVGKLLFLANLNSIEMTRDEAKELFNQLQPLEPLTLEQRLLLSQSFQLPNASSFLFIFYCKETNNMLKQRLSFGKCVAEAVKLGVTEVQAIDWLREEISSEEQHQKFLDRTYRTPEGS